MSGTVLEHTLKIVHVCYPSTEKHFMQLFSRVLHKMIGKYANKDEVSSVHLVIFDQHLRGEEI